MGFWGDLLTIIWADIILSGDNALIIGLAAAGLPKHLRQRAIVFGMVLATAARIFFAIIAVYLLHIPGIKFVGGLLLLWVCWRLYQDIRQVAANPAIEVPDQKETNDQNSQKKFRSALFSILVADVSMSLDNVITVAAIAHKNVGLLVFGLLLSIVLMAFFATIIVKVLTRYPIISYLGLVLLIYISGTLLYKGWPEVEQLLT